MPVETYTERDRRLMQEYRLTTPEAGEAELQRLGVSYRLDSRNNLEYRYHGVDGPGWMVWCCGHGYVAGSKLGALLALIDALRR